MEGHVGQGDLEVHTLLVYCVVPQSDALVAVLHIIVAQPGIERRQGWLIHQLHLTVDQPHHLIGVVQELVVIFDPVLFIAALDAGIKGVGGIG